MQKTRGTYEEPSTKHYGITLPIVWGDFWVGMTGGKTAEAALEMVVLWCVFNDPKYAQILHRANRAGKTLAPKEAIKVLREQLRTDMVNAEILEYLNTLSDAERGKVLAEIKKRG